MLYINEADREQSITRLDVRKLINDETPFNHARPEAEK